MNRLSPRRVFVVLTLGGSFAVHAALAAGPGAVATDEEDATRVAGDVLGAGGNAVDAAVAAALALAVVHPGAGNLGGGGFAVVRVGGELAALDFREVAPRAAHARMFLDQRGEPRPGASLVGPLAAGVPGSPTGLYELHRRFGRLPWARVVEPAVALARDGFEISAWTSRALARDSHKLAGFPETAAVWLPGGRPLAWGERVRHPRLAATLAEYAARGPAAITGGAVAAAVADASRRHGGVLDAGDLAAYRPQWREPLRFSRFGWDLAGMPLPSSGGVIVGQVLGMLERRGWRDMAPASVERAHLLAEAWRRAFADRFLLADPASSRATPAQLLDSGWLDRRAASIDTRLATPSARLRPYPAAELAAEPSETTHVSVIDGEGNLAALTTTLNDIFGCLLWVPEIGFLNDEMDDFATAPGRPNDFGLVQGEANAVAPGKRMLSSMSPTLAWRGAEAIVIGGRGGGKIPTGLVQVLLALWEGDAARAAVARPRLHHQWLPDRLEYELGAMSAPAAAELERRGHALSEILEGKVGRVNVVRRLADGTLEAAGDPRGPGVGVVFLPR